MYEERKKDFELKGLIIKILVFVLFLFLMLWLFPSKKYLDKHFATKDDVKNITNKELDKVYGQLFTANINKMKDASIGYFTKDRMPKKVGDTVTLTLNDMIDKHMLIEFKDSNNEICSKEKSYAQVIKKDNEYQMKVQLSCSDFEDYIIVYIGKYDLFDQQIINNINSQPQNNNFHENNVTNNVKPNNKIESNDLKPMREEYLYEYKKIAQKQYDEWGPWSEWSRTPVIPDDSQVEIESRRELVGYRDEKDSTFSTKTSYKTEYVKVKTGTKKVADGNTKKTIPAKKYMTNAYYDNTKMDYITSKKPLKENKEITLSNGDKVLYKYHSQNTEFVCNNGCKNVTTYKYKRYTKKYHKSVSGYSCPTDYKRSGTNCYKYSPKYKYVDVYETREKKIPYIEEVENVSVNKVPVYQTVKYYRSRKHKLIKHEEIKYEWSKTSDDKKLINLGYIFTGYKKEV